jgi:hypothetical protein
MDDDIGMKPVIFGVRRHGIDIRACDDFGMRGAADQDHLAFTTGRGLVLVTANRGHFEHLHRTWIAEAQTHGGIVVVRQRLAIGDQVRALVAIHALFEEDEIRGQLLHLSDWI